MSGDRQDFLERKEAWQRRMQQRAGQKPSASRSAQPAGPQPKARPPVSPESKIGGASQPKAGKTSQRQETAEHPTFPAASAGLEERSPAGGPVGRRSAARRRDELAGLAALPTRPKPPLLSRVIIWGTVAICGLLILATLGEVWTVYRLNQQIDANQQTAAELQAQNQQLSNAIQQLQQPSTIEQEARKLGFIFPGDQPVVVVTTTPTATPASHTAPPTSNWWGFWPDWLKLFFGG